MRGAPGETPTLLPPRTNPIAVTRSDVLRGAVALIATVAVLGVLVLAAGRVLPTRADLQVPHWLVILRGLFLLPPLLLFAVLAARHESLPSTIRPGALLAGFALTLWMAFQFAAVWLRIPYDVTLRLAPALGAILAAGVTTLLIGGVRQARKLRHRSEHDPLTGLLNRHGAARVWNRLPHDAPVALALIDLNELKTVNDEHGHDAGDALLRTSAEALESACRPHGWAARWGGDEFLVAFPRESEQRAHDLLRQAARATGTPRGELPVWAIGIAVTTAEEPLAAALERADTHMYADKAQHYDTIAPGPAPTAAPFN